MSKELTEQQRKNLIKAGYKVNKNGDLVIEERGFFRGSQKTKKSPAKSKK